MSLFVLLLKMDLILSNLINQHLVTIDMNMTVSRLLLLAILLLLYSFLCNSQYHFRHLE